MVAGSLASPTNEDVVPQRNRDPLESRTRSAGLRDAGKLRVVEASGTASRRRPHSADSHKRPSPAHRSHSGFLRNPDSALPQLRETAEQQFRQAERLLCIQTSKSYPLMFISRQEQKKPAAPPPGEQNDRLFERSEKTLRTGRQRIPSRRTASAWRRSRCSSLLRR